MARVKITHNKEMKKSVIIFLLAIVAVFGAHAQFRLASIVGGTLTNLKFKQDLVAVDQVFGGQAGVQAEMMFPGIGFGVDLGLIYNLAGAKVNLGERLIWWSQGYGNERVMLHQLNIPIHLRFKYTRLGGLEDYLAPFVYGGPDFNINLAHSNCGAFDVPSGDLALVAGGGVEIMRRWQVSASYSWGMTYVIRTKLLTDFSARSRQWTVRLAYFF